MIYHRYTFEPNVLQPNTTYYWSVTAYTKDLKHVQHAANSTFSFTTEPLPCSPLLYATHGHDQSVTIWFHPVAGAQSYQILYGTKPGEYGEKVSDVLESPYTITGLQNDTEYYFAVVAVNKHGQSSIWNERPATPRST